MGTPDDLATRTTAALGLDLGAESLYGADFAPGAMVGDYVVEERRSRGGFATVYRARHFRGGPDIALKVLHRMLVHAPNMILRFRQEADAIRRLAHANIVEFLAYGELPDGRPFFVMEWLTGRSLDEELEARGPFTPAEALTVAEDLAAALGAAHAAGVIHRDLKPSNVIAQPAGGDLTYKLVDFGIAKLVADDGAGRHDLTSTGMRIGTPHYMAPEQIAGQAIDRRTDVYSLGVVLFQLLTGQPPFTAPTPVEVEGQHLYAPPPRASDLAPVSNALDAVLQRCLAKRPDDRYPDVAALLVDLRRATGGGGDEIADPDVRQSQRALARRVTALGLHVRARLAGAADPDQVDDAVLDELDRVVDEARAACAAAGLRVVAEGSSSFLAACEAPADAGAELAARRRLLAAALALVAGTGAGAVELELTAHAAPAVVTATGELVGGDLLRLTQWVAEGRPGLAATATALAGLEDELASEAGDRPDLRWLRPVRRG